MRRRIMAHISPLRYPGGKTLLTGFLNNLININKLQGCQYFEPYAGGAGAALGLLSQGVVSRVFLNDADTRVYSFWHSILKETNKFIDTINRIPLTIDEWKRQHFVCENPKSSSLFELGVATFYMNRCNRSGVITGAGPIGGYEQNGKWLMNARFNRESLSERIQAVAKMKKHIIISNNDAICFLKEKLPAGRGRKKVFVYLDPPYVVKGKSLYMNAYISRDHEMLARYMSKQFSLPWVMSYDNTDLIRSLYSECNQSYMRLQYSLQDKRAAKELIIVPKHVIVPKKLLAM